MISLEHSEVCLEKSNLGRTLSEKLTPAVFSLDIQLKNFCLSSISNFEVAQAIDIDLDRRTHR